MGVKNGSISSKLINLEAEALLLDVLFFVGLRLALGLAWYLALGIGLVREFGRRRGWRIGKPGSVGLSRLGRRVLLDSGCGGAGSVLVLAGGLEVEGWPGCLALFGVL